MEGRLISCYRCFDRWRPCLISCYRCFDLWKARLLPVQYIVLMIITFLCHPGTPARKQLLLTLMPEQRQWVKFLYVLYSALNLLLAICIFFTTGVGCGRYRGLYRLSVIRAIFSCGALALAVLLVLEYGTPMIPLVYLWNWLLVTSLKINPNATYSFDAGPVGLAYNADGIVTELTPNGQSFARGVSRHSLIVRVDTERFSRDALDRAQRSGNQYEVTFQTMRGCTHPRGWIRAYFSLYRPGITRPDDWLFNQRLFSIPMLVAIVPFLIGYFEDSVYCFLLASACRVDLSQPWNFFGTVVQTFTTFKVGCSSTCSSYGVGFCAHDAERSPETSTAIQFASSSVLASQALQETSLMQLFWLIMICINSFPTAKSGPEPVGESAQEQVEGTGIAQSLISSQSNPIAQEPVLQAPLVLSEENVTGDRRIRFGQRVLRSELRGIGAELQERLAAGEADSENVPGAPAAPQFARQIANQELNRLNELDVLHQHTCSLEFLAQLRFVAFIHNCSRYNRLELLNIIDRPRIVQLYRLDRRDSLYHQIKTDARGCCGCQRAQPSACLMIAIIWFFVALFPYAYVTGTKDVDGKLADFIRQQKVFAGLLLMMGVLFMTSILQLIFGRKIGIDQPCRYKIAFFVYYYVYKWWQAKVILESMPGLVYNNLCLVNTWGLFEPVAISVVGIAVNTIQCLWLMVGAIMVLAVYKSGRFSMHSVATDFAVAWVIAYAMHRATVLAIGFLLGQSNVYIARINHKIGVVDSNKEDGYDGMLHNMINNAELVVRRQDLERLADLHKVVPPEAIRPSATCVRRITIVLNDGSHYEVDLANGSAHRLF